VSTITLTLLFGIGISRLQSTGLSSSNNTWVESKLAYMSTRTFGYSDTTNYIRRARMILDDLHAHYPSLDTVPLSFADYGSNFGWFSCLLAKELPHAVVFSIEGGIQPDAAEGKGVTFHRGFLEKHQLENNVVCNARFGRNTFDVFETSNLRFDVQLLMSVVHWVEKWPAYNGTRASWEHNVCAWLSVAHTSFVEMVNPRGKVQQGTDRNHPVWVWYDGREDEWLVLNETLRACGLQASVREVHSPGTHMPPVGATHSRRLQVLINEEARKMFRIDLLHKDSTPVTLIKKKLTCDNVLGAIGCAVCGESHVVSLNGSSSVNIAARLFQKRMDTEIQKPASNVALDGAFDCTMTTDIQNLLQLNGSKVPCFRGYSKTAFIFQMAGRAVALKIPSASSAAKLCNDTTPYSSSVIGQTAHMKREVELMSDVWHHSLPRLYGHCGAVGSAWTLVEAGLPLKESIGKSYSLNTTAAISSALIPVINFFISLNRRSMMMIDFAAKQFSLIVRSDRPHVALVDLDGLRSVDYVLDKLSTLNCSGSHKNECPKLANTMLSLHHSSYKFECRDSKCVVSDVEKLMVELFCVHVIHPLSASSSTMKEFLDGCSDSQMSLEELHTWVFNQSEVRG